jgi:hypothetical protein
MKLAKTTIWLRARRERRFGAGGGVPGSGRKASEADCGTIGLRSGALAAAEPFVSSDC